MQKIDAPVSNTISDLGSVLGAIKNVLLYGGIVVAIIVIIIAGGRYVMSQGDPKAISGAQRAITMAVIGMIIILLANVIISFVLNVLVK